VDVASPNSYLEAFGSNLRIVPELEVRRDLPLLVREELDDLSEGVPAVFRKAKGEIHDNDDEDDTEEGVGGTDDDGVGDEFVVEGVNEVREGEELSPRDSLCLGDDEVLINSGSFCFVGELDLEGPCCCP
jgi:hypothetical protein